MKKIIAALLTALLLCIFISTAEESSEPELARGYVYVTAGTDSKWFPLPEEEEYSFTIRQRAQDGTEVNNEITVTPDGVYMSFSDCDNQDCVGEGMITLENKATRILGNMILCLPHQVSIYLYATEELITESEAEG